MYKRMLVALDGSEQSRKALDHAAAIADVAENEGYDIIVMGSRGIGAIMDWILGSTSRRVVDSCTKPVLIIKTS